MATGTLRFHQQTIDASEVQNLGAAVAASMPATVALVVVSVNTINDLPTVPVSAVDFYVNGSLVRSGISNAGVSVTVNPSLLGFNLALTDEVTAVYAS